MDSVTQFVLKRCFMKYFLGLIMLKLFINDLGEYIKKRNEESVPPQCQAAYLKPVGYKYLGICIAKINIY